MYHVEVDTISGFCIFCVVSYIVASNCNIQFLLLGAVPFPRDVKRLKDLGVHGVITLNEPYETLVPTALYKVIISLCSYNLSTFHLPF